MFWRHDKIDRPSYITAMWPRYSSDALAAADLARRQAEQFILRGFVVGEWATPREDCLMLYLLIRHFERRHVFEIGTFIGTTAVCMNEAVRKNGGVLTTADPVDYRALSPWSGIRFICGPASLALHILESEGHKIDFSFMDWIPDEAALRLMLKVFDPHAVIAVHDFVAGDDKQKGNMIVRVLNESYCKGRLGTWHLPPTSPAVMPDGTRVNICTAFFVPQAESRMLPQTG
jgi:predicted O-methyltransferase YrrM